MMVCMEPVHLILGDDEFLAERARKSIQKAVAEETGDQPELKVLRAAEVTEWEILEATSPSLFGETRVIVISDTERVGSALIKLIVDAAKDPAPGMTMVVNFAISRKNLKNRKKPPELVAKIQSWRKSTKSSRFMTMRSSRGQRASLHRTAFARPLMWLMHFYPAWAPTYVLWPRPFPSWWPIPAAMSRGKPCSATTPGLRK